MPYTIIVCNYLSCLEVEDEAYVKRQAEREKSNVVELKFKEMIQKYDFMSVVMYPELKMRREFERRLYKR